jgi:hypothetical protein
MSDPQVDVKVEVSAITPQYKRDSQEVDPSSVRVQLLFQGEANRVFLLNMFLGSDYVKKLNLTVGDKLTLKLIKESQ